MLLSGDMLEAIDDWWDDQPVPAMALAEIDSLIVHGLGSVLSEVDLATATSLSGVKGSDVGGLLLQPSEWPQRGWI